MNVLVTAASRGGSTLEIAEAIARRLRTSGFAVTVGTPDSVETVDEYDAAIVGSAVYRGHWLEPATAFIQRHAAALSGHPLWLFSSGPVGAPDRALARKMAVDPVEVAGLLRRTGARGHRRFGGKLAGTGLTRSQRYVLRLVRGLEGDWRDWHAVDAWADEIAATLSRAAWFERLDE